MLLLGSVVLCMNSCGFSEPTALPTSSATLHQASPSPAPTLTSTPPVPGIGPSAIYLVEPDGSHLRQLATGTHPQFSSDGKYLSFVQRDRNRETLVLYDRQSEEMRAIELLGDLYEYAWSPDAQHIAALVNGKPGTALILIAPQSGEMQTVAVAYRFHSLFWSPNSHFIAYVETNAVLYPMFTPLANEDEPIKASLLLYDTVSRQSITLLEWPGSICSPTWSPASTQIAFTVGRRASCTGAPVSDEDIEPYRQLYRIDVHANGLTPLTNADSTVTDVKWSPTRDILAYINEDTHDTELHIVDLDNQSEKRSTNIAPAASLVWSPDGNQVIVGTVMTVKMFNATSLSQQTLTSAPLPRFWPIGWSPDGKKLLIGMTCCGLKSFIFVDINKAGEEHEVDEELRRDVVFTTEDPVWAPDAELIAFSGFKGCRCP